MMMSILLLLNAIFWMQKLAASIMKVCGRFGHWSYNCRFQTPGKNVQTSSQSTWLTAKPLPNEFLIHNSKWKFSYIKLKCTGFFQNIKDSVSLILVILTKNQVSVWFQNYSGFDLLTDWRTNVHGRHFQQKVKYTLISNN